MFQHSSPRSGVFDKLSKQDTVTWNAIIAGCVQHGHTQEAFRIFYLMQEEGNKPDRYTYVSILKACSSISALEQGRLIHAHVTKSGFEPDVYVNNVLIFMYAKCSKLEDARNVFDQSSKRPVVTWSTMIAGYAQHGQSHEAFCLFKQMQQDGNKPDNITVVSILKACSNITEGKLVHDYVIESSFELDLFVGSALIDMYIKCGNLEDAHILFDRLSECDVVTWSSMIEGYAQHGFGQEALRLFQQMQQEGLQPNSVTFISTLKACSSIAALCQGKLIHELIIQSGLELGRLIGNTLIDMYFKCGSLEDACKVFAKLPEKDVVTWNSMIAGFALHSDYTLAVQYFENMQQECVKPDCVTFVCLLSACNQLGLVDKGSQLFESMRKDHKIRPMQEHYYCMAGLFGRTGRLTEAEDILQLLPSRTGIMGWMSLLSNCTNYGNVMMGRYCFDHVLTTNSSFTPGYVLMSNIYAGVDMLEDASKISEMKNCTYGWKKPGRAFIEINMSVYDFTVGDQSHPQRIDIYAKLKQLSEQMGNEGHVPCLNSLVP